MLRHFLGFVLFLRLFQEGWRVIKGVLKKPSRFLKVIFWAFQGFLLSCLFLGFRV